MRPTGTAEELERRRRRAVELMQRGESPTVIARILGVRRTSLYRWLGMAEEGPEALAAKPHPGPMPRLSDEQLQELEGLLLRGAKAHGWHNDLWSARRVAEVIRRRFGIEYHVEHVRKVIRRRLRWSSQKPQLKAKQRNDEKIAHWRAEELPRIVEQAEERKAHLVFRDESGFQLTPTVRRTYAPRGKTPIQGAWHRKGRISAISAVTVSPVRRRPNLYFRLLPDNTNAHGEDTVAFLAQLRDQIRGPMTIVWDRSKIHGRSSVVKAYLAKHPEIVTEDFPGYAPEANPDEGVWGWTKYHRLPNYAPEDTRELRFRLWEELSALRERPDLLASFIRHAGIPLQL
jgi:transposase